MKIDNLAALEKVLKTCRKHGVTAIEIDGIKMNILELTASKKSFSIANDIPEANIKVPQYNGVLPTSAPDKIDTQELTDEQLLMWSAGSSEPTLGNEQ